MKREDIKELYSIDFINGTLRLIKRDIDDWVRRADRYTHVSDVLINPKIDISKSGILTISGIRLSFIKIGWNPTPLTLLSENWRDLIFYDEYNITKKDVIEWKGFFPFKRRIKHKDVDHLEGGNYLKTNGYQDIQTTSNYRLVGFKAKDVKGLIK